MAEEAQLGHAQDALGGVDDQSVGCKEPEQLA